MDVKDIMICPLKRINLLTIFNENCLKKPWINLLLTPFYKLLFVNNPTCFVWQKITFYISFLSTFMRCTTLRWATRGMVCSGIGIVIFAQDLCSAAQELWFVISVPQITHADFAESYIKKKGKARPILPTMHCGSFKKIYGAKLEQCQGTEVTVLEAVIRRLSTINWS